MTVSRDDILDLIERRAGRRPSNSQQQDLFGVFGIDGDDATELLEEFAAEFDVRMDGFIWYFHHDSEPPGIAPRVVPMGPDGIVLPMIPVTVEMLFKSIQRGEWVVSYPDHTVKVVPVAWRTIALIAATAVCGGALLLLLMGCRNC